MSLVLYGITDDSRDPGHGLCGLGGTAIRCIHRAGLTAIVSEHAEAPALDEDTLWTFERVIESFMAGGAVLPVRFGTTLATAEEVQAMLERRRTELIAKLEDVRGAVELSVRGVWSHPPEPTSTSPETTGTSYMLERLEPQRRARALAAQVHAHLDGRARASRHRIMSGPLSPVSAAFLVDCGTQADFVRAVTDLDVQLADVDLICTGPWPAYSFVGNATDE